MIRVRHWQGATVVGPELDIDIDVDPEGPPPLTLTVDGGELVWTWRTDPAGSLDPVATLAGPPLAVLDDPITAQDWLWAFYGRDAALAVESGSDDPLRWEPGQPWLPALAARLAGALWWSVWWPASDLDGIPAIDAAALVADLTASVDRLDVLGEGPAALLSAVHVPLISPRADRYALAAGADDEDGPGLGGALTTGSTGIAWSDCPAGWVDASMMAVSWRILDDLGHWSIRVRVAAGPVSTSEVTLTARIAGESIALHPGRDAWGRCWHGERTGSGWAPAVSDPVRVFLPGFAPEHPGPTAWQESVRSLARGSLGQDPVRPWRLGADDD